jgi:hypothetical protein
MTQPQTATDVAMHLAQLSRQLDSTVRELAALDDAAVRARARLTSDYARAFLSADGSMDVRKHTATLQTADRALDADLADAKVRAAKEAIRTIQTRIDVGRSYGAAVRAEIALAGAS